jgi:hypothetical protein
MALGFIPTTTKKEKKVQEIFKGKKGEYLETL